MVSSFHHMLVRLSGFDVAGKEEIASHRVVFIWVTSYIDTFPLLRGFQTMRG